MVREVWVGRDFGFGRPVPSRVDSRDVPRVYLDDPPGLLSSPAALPLGEWNPVIPPSTSRRERLNPAMPTERTRWQPVTRQPIDQGTRPLLPRSRGDLGNEGKRRRRTNLLEVWMIWDGSHATRRATGRFPERTQAAFRSDRSANDRRTPGNLATRSNPATPRASRRTNPPTPTKQTQFPSDARCRHPRTNPADVPGAGEREGSAAAGRAESPNEPSGPLRGVGRGKASPSARRSDPGRIDLGVSQPDRR